MEVFFVSKVEISAKDLEKQVASVRTRLAELTQVTGCGGRFGAWGWEVFGDFEYLQSCDTLPKTNSKRSEKLPGPNREGSFSNHHFQGPYMLNLGGNHDVLFVVVQQKINR